MATTNNKTNAMAIKVVVMIEAIVHGWTMLFYFWQTWQKWLDRPANFTLSIGVPQILHG